MIRSALTEWTRRRPGLTGALLLVVGFFAAGNSIENGTEHARMLEGPTVTGRVLQAKMLDGSRYWVEFIWSDPAGKRHTKVIESNRRDLAALKRGDEVALMLHPDDPSRARLAYRLRGKSLIGFAGIQAESTVFIGLALALGGLLMIAFRQQIAPDRAGAEETTRDLRAGVL